MNEKSYIFFILFLQSNFIIFFMGFYDSDKYWEFLTQTKTIGEKKRHILQYIF